MNKGFQDVPDWLKQSRQNLEASGWKPDYDLEYMWNDFRDSFTKAAVILDTRKRAESGIMDLVMTVGGKILEATAMFQQSLMQPLPVTRDADTQKKKRDVRWAGIKQAPGNAEITCTILSKDDHALIEINVADSEEHTDIRPFIIEVRDETGSCIVESMRVEKRELPPIFPAPEVGWYRFVLAWDGGEDDMVIRVQ